MGATSSVYEVLLHGSSQMVAAAKVPTPPHSVSSEKQVLLALQAGGCPGIPELLGELDGGQGLLLQPVGAPLDVDVLTKHPRLFEVVGQLVDTLEAAHRLGWLHCDIRADNLLAKEVPACKLFIVDWCVARRASTTS